jgi:hypothetical protein
MRQGVVIGGYTPSASNFDALIFGCYEGDKAPASGPDPFEL